MRRTGLSLHAYSISGEGPPSIRAVVNRFFPTRREDSGRTLHIDCRKVEVERGLEEMRDTGNRTSDKRRSTRDKNL